MRKGKLQNVTDTLCQMFCGWRLDYSKAKLVELGSVTLEIDALTGECSVEGMPIHGLPIVREIQLWLRSELGACHIPLETLSRAKLKAKLSFSKITWDARTKKGDTFYAHGEVVRTEEMHRCQIECESEVATNDGIYRSNFKDVEEWPIGWPES